MTEQITLEEALKLVNFEFIEGAWRVGVVRGNCGIVEGDCGAVIGRCNRVRGDCGIVEGDCGVVEGNCLIDVWGTISGRRWQYAETPKQKLGRLIKETGNKDLLEAFNQLENN